MMPIRGRGVITQGSGLSTKTYGYLVDWPARI